MDRTSPAADDKLSREADGPSDTGGRVGAGGASDSADVATRAARLDLGKQEGSSSRAESASESPADFAKSAEAADPATRDARGALASRSTEDTGRGPVAAGGSDSSKDNRIPIAAGGNEGPADKGQPTGDQRIAGDGSADQSNPRPLEKITQLLGDSVRLAKEAAAKEGREGNEQGVVHPPDGVGYAFDSHETEVKVLGDRLAGLPAEVGDALKQGGENVRVEITAGASRAGPTSYNQDLSAARGQDMAGAMRDLGVKAEIRVNAVGERVAAEAGAPDGVDNPADRVATFRVEVGQEASDKSAPGGDTSATTGGEQTTAGSESRSEQHPSPPSSSESGADSQIEPRGKGSDLGVGRLVDPTDTGLGGPGATWAQKWGGVEPGPLPKGVSVAGKEPLVKDSFHAGGFDESDSVDTGAGEFSGRVRAGAWGKGEAGVKVSDKGVGVYGEAGVAAGGQATGQWGIGEKLSVGATGFAGAKGNAAAEASFGPKGLAAGAKVDAFAGGSLGGDLKLGGDTASATGGVEGLAGIGARAEAKGRVGWDKVEARVKIGAAFGLGLSVSLGVSFSPKGIASGVADGARGAVNFVRDLF